MGKKKIALFYDESTESGKQILEFLTPFDKRKSDIVGELILLWIAEYGMNVPVQWLSRKKGEPGAVKPGFPKAAFQERQETMTVSTAAVEEIGAQDVVVAEVAEEEKPLETEHDVSLIKACLASFL